MARVLRLLWIVIKSGHSYLSTSDKYMVIYVWHSRLCECQGVKMVVTRNKPGVNMFVYCVSSTTLSSIAHLHCQEPLKLKQFQQNIMSLLLLITLFQSHIHITELNQFFCNSRLWNRPINCSLCQLLELLFSRLFLYNLFFMTLSA